MAFHAIALSALINDSFFNYYNKNVITYNKNFNNLLNFLYLCIFKQVQNGLFMFCRFRSAFQIYCNARLFIYFLIIHVNLTNVK